MKRLMKKANQEFNKIIIDYFNNDEKINYGYTDQNQQSRINNENYEKLNYIKIILDFNINVFPILENEKENFKRYLNQIRNDIGMVKEIIQPILVKIIKEKYQIDDILPTYIDNSKYLEIIRNFESKQNSLIKKNEHYAPYMCSVYDVFDYFRVEVGLLLETKEDCSDIIEKIETYIQNVMNETYFVDITLNEYWFKKHKINSFDSIIRALWDKSKKDSFSINRYIEYNDFYSRFNEIVKKHYLSVVMGRIWNESTIPTKYKIRNFIKTETGEDIVKG